MSNLNGQTILVLVSNGVDEAVMSSVQRELLKTGAAAKTVGTENGLVNSWNPGAGPLGGWGLYFPVDQQIGQTLGADFDVLVVPSGQRSIAKLAANPHAERIISSFVAAGKKMVFMGDAVELLAKTNLARGFTLTGPAALEKTMIDAGAEFTGAVEQQSGNLMTGTVQDTDAFISSMIAFLSDDAGMKAAA